MADVKNASNITLRRANYLTVQDSLFFSSQHSIILENPSQIPKKIVSDTQDDMPAVNFVKENTESALETIVRSINQKGSKQETILIINRYRDIGKPNNIDELKLAYPKLIIDYTTAHKSKGLTVDCVIIMGLRSGLLCFHNTQLLTLPLFTSDSRLMQTIYLWDLCIRYFRKNIVLTKRNTD